MGWHPRQLEKFTERVPLERCRRSRSRTRLPRSESATCLSASAEAWNSSISSAANGVSRIGTAPEALTIDGTDRATPSTPWKSLSTVHTGMTACSSFSIASTMRALERPIA